MNEVREALGELERELRVRGSVYPRMVAQGKLTQGEADRRLRAMRYAVYLVDAALNATVVHTPTTGE